MKRKKKIVVYILLIVSASIFSLYSRYLLYFLNHLNIDIPYMFKGNQYIGYPIGFEKFSTHCPEFDLASCYTTVEEFNIPMFILNLLLWFLFLFLSTAGIVNLKKKLF